MSKRRDVLLQRLKHFVHTKALHPHLPMRVRKVLGFGSFFRGKAIPHDIDLAVVAGLRHDIEPNSDEQRHSNYRPKLFEQWRKKAWDSLMIDRGKPHENLQRAFPQVPSEVATWFASYSRTALNPSTISEEVSLGTVFDITRRMLKGIPNVKVMDLVWDESKLSQDRPYTLVWSEDLPDIEYNLRNAHAPNRELLGKEYVNLACQLDTAENRYDLGVQFLHALSKYRPAKKWCSADDKNVDAFLDFFFCSLHQHGRSGEEPSERDQEEIDKFASVKGLAQYVEWLRGEVKDAKFRETALGYVAHALRSARGNPEELLVCTVDATPKRVYNVGGFKEALTTAADDVKRGSRRYHEKCEMLEKCQQLAEDD